MAARKSASKKQNLVEQEIQEASSHDEIDNNISDNTPMMDSSEAQEAHQECNTIDNDDQKVEILFEDCLTLDLIQEFVETATHKMNDSHSVCIDLSNSDEISTAAVQAIICLNRYAIEKEKKLSWKNPTSGFSDAFNNLGFYSEMMKLEFVK